MFDALVSPEVLALAPSTARLIPVGKVAGNPGIGQEGINWLIRKFLRRGLVVVRLKGGDPMVFGRAAEEIQAGIGAGFHVDVVPGISSYSAASASFLMPVTRREVASGFWVITATNANADLNPDIELAAKSTSTVIILMGLHKIERIGELFARYRSPEEPVAVCSRVSLPDESIMVGTAENIAQLCLHQSVASPALIVVGQCVAHMQRSELRSMFHSASQ
jgi:uroporphyrin-III C-methyltransferase